MSLTVENILNFMIFKNHTLLAGKKGLSNKVRHISVADNPSNGLDYILSKKGDFFLTSLYLSYQSCAKMIDFFDVLVKTECAGVCIIDQFISELPSEVKKFCDDNNLPVILISSSVPYSTIIEEVMNKIQLKQQQQLYEAQISLLINGNLNTSQKEVIVKAIFPNIKNLSIALYFKINNIHDNYIEPITAYFNSFSGVYSFIYNDGLLCLVTDIQDETNAKKNKIDALISYFKKYFKKYNIGVSSKKTSRFSIDKIISQAIIASSLSTTATSINYYDNLGVYKILLPLQNTSELEGFIYDTLNNVMDYDNHNNTQLLSTLETFLNNNRNYRECAKKMYTHENTVRYRIQKSLEIANMINKEDIFFENVSIALKAIKLKQ